MSKTEGKLLCLPSRWAWGHVELLLEDAQEGLQPAESEGSPPAGTIPSEHGARLPGCPSCVGAQGPGRQDEQSRGSIRPAALTKSSPWTLLRVHTRASSQGNTWRLPSSDSPKKNPSSP